LKQTYEDKEIIAVDNNSTDGSANIVIQYPITLVSESVQGKAAACNKGLVVASGDIIAFTQPDCIVPEDWIETAVSMLQENPQIGGVGGPFVSKTRTPVSKALDFLYYGRGQTEEKYVNSVAGMNVFYRKQLLLDVGGFSNDYDRIGSSSDVDLNYRIIEKGYSLFFTPKLRIVHNHVTQFIPMMRRWYIYGLSMGKLWVRHPRRSTPIVLPRLFYIPSILFFAIGSFFCPLFIYLLLASTLGLYLVYLSIFFTRAKPRRNDMLFALVFSSVHTSKQIAQTFGVLASFLALLKERLFNL